MTDEQRERVKAICDEAVDTVCDVFARVVDAYDFEIDAASPLRDPEVRRRIVMSTMGPK